MIQKKSGIPIQYIFGPVPSRRLGRSLGIDLVPYKTCTYDCVYCQLGRTTVKTAHREAFAPVKTIVGEISCKLEEKNKIDNVVSAIENEKGVFYTIK